MQYSKFRIYTILLQTLTLPMQAAVIKNHGNVNVPNMGQGEAQHRKYKKLKLGGGQTYDCSNV
jgi:hypothetical protein